MTPTQKMGAALVAGSLLWLAWSCIVVAARSGRRVRADVAHVHTLADKQNVIGGDDHEATQDYLDWLEREGMPR